MPPMNYLTTSLVILSLALSACGGEDESRSRGPAPLVQVGDESVRDEQFAAYLRHRNASPRTQEQLDRMLEDYANREALAQAIEGSDLLDAELTAAELNELRKEMLISRYFERFLDAAVTEDEVQQYYEAHAEEYEDRKVHVAHILVRTNPRMTETERQAARSKAQEALSRLNTGEDFGAVAQDLSEDAASARRGGDMGFIREGTIHPAFSEIAFGLDTGATSEIVETPFGYHVIRAIEGAQTIRRPLDAVRGDIRARLRQQAREMELARLRESVNVEIREGGFDLETAQEQRRQASRLDMSVVAPSMEATMGRRAPEAESDMAEPAHADPGTMGAEDEG